MGITWIYTSHTVSVTTRILRKEFDGIPYEPSFVAVVGWGVDPRYSLDPASFSQNFGHRKNFRATLQPETEKN